MEEYIYSSEYYCEDCECYHSVGVFSDGDKFIVNDDDGDTIAEYLEYVEVVRDFPEGINNVVNIKKEKKVSRWHMILNSDLTVQSFLKYGNPFSQASKRLWISPKEVPEEIRLTLGLTEEDRIDPEIKNMESLLKNMGNINGEQRKYRNVLTNIFSFDVITFE